MRTLALFTLMMMTMAGFAAAQSVAGVFTTPTSNGAITLTLEQNGQNVSGTLVGDDGTTFRVQGTFDGQQLMGALANASGTVAGIQGGLYDAGVQFYLIPLDPNGNPNHEGAQQFVMQRQAGSSTASPPAGLSGLEREPAEPLPPSSEVAPPGTALSGVYRGDISGTAATLTLHIDAGRLRGAIDAAGYGYTLEGTASGDAGRGTLSDPQAGSSMPFEISESGGTVTLSMLLQDPATGQTGRVPFTFRRSGAADAGVPSGGAGSQNAPGGRAATPHDPGEQGSVQRDPALIGNWSYNDTYTSNDARSSFSTTTRYFLQISPDGSYAYGSSMSAGLDNDLGSVQGNAGSGDVSRGQWRTENSIVYIMEPGSPQWVPYARYYLEGNSMMLTFENGKRQVWHRR